MSEAAPVVQEVEVLAPEVELPESAQAPAEPPAPETEQEPKSEEKPQTAKTFTQEEVDAIAAKERAIAERKAAKKATREYERRLEELTRQPVQQQQPAARQEGKPKLEQFTQVEDYVEAVTDWKLQTHQQAQAQHTEAQRQAQVAQEVHIKAQSVFDTAEDEPGFDADEFKKVRIEDAMAFAILESDIAPKIMVHLQNNPAEADKIAKLSPARQAAEIGKLEVKLSTPMVEKVKVSSAPAPVKPVGSRGVGTSKNPADMPQKDFEKWLYGR